MKQYMKAWIHRQCAGLSQTLLEENNEPFYCPHYHLVLQDKQFQELKGLVDALSKEVVTLKAPTLGQLAPESSPSTPQQQSLRENFKCC